MTVAAEPMAHAERLWQEWLDWAAGQGIDVARRPGPGFRGDPGPGLGGERVCRHRRRALPRDLRPLLASGDLDRPYGPAAMGQGLAAAPCGPGLAGADEPALQHACAASAAAR